MLSRLRSLFNPLRISIPLLVDVIMVSDPEQIRRIETSGGVDRLHTYETSDLPWWVRFYFRATKFHDDRRDLWFLPLEPSADPSYAPRLAHLVERVARGYQEEDVKRIAELLRADASDQALAHEMVQVVNRRFFGQEVPAEVTSAANRTLQNLGEAVLPWKYLRARKALRTLMDYCERTLPADVHLLDSGHNIGEVVQATARGLRILHHHLDEPVEQLFTAHPLTLQSPRIAVRSTTFGGLLRLPTSAGRTVVIYNIGKAARKTHDLDFTFSAGGPERQCVFRDFFLSFMHDLQEELRRAPV